MPTLARRFAAFTVICVFAVGCSSDDPPGATPTTSPPPPTSELPVSIETSAPATTTEPPTTATAPLATTAPSEPAPVAACDVPDTAPLESAPADSSGQDYDVTSFDGTVIRVHWFPVPTLADGATAPTVLMGPGWGSAGDTDTSEAGESTGQFTIRIASLGDAGYNVLTWDPRGFGESTGTVTVDSPDNEGRDVQQLLDWVASQPQAALDAERDPVVGMLGFSYGGGIQLVTAAIDCRIDAIVPIVAWNSLTTSLFKAGTPKTGWSGLLSAASAGRDLDPTIVRANESGSTTGVVAPEDVQWFADRGPGEAVATITVPTLIIQGTVDTLFTLDEGVANYQLLGEGGAPRSMLWFCGGHGVCLTDDGDPGRVADAAIAWLDRYVKDDESVDTGPGFEFVDQDGVTYTADGFPEPDGEPLTGQGSGSLELVAEGGSGPAVLGSGSTSLLDSFIAPITPARADNAVNVAIPAGDELAVVVGAPELSLTYSGSVTAGDRPTRVFAQLVDESTGLVIGNQITPIAVTLDGDEHTVTVPIETIAFSAKPGSIITLQIVATTVAYAEPQLGGNVEFSDISVTLPVVTAVSRAG